MHEIDECRVLVLRGLELENRPTGRRSITLLSREAWSDTCRDLGADLPWWTRRANLLVEGLDLSTTIGLIVEVGSIRVRIHDETRPCKLMEEQFAGLRQVLKPAYRGGVFGQVLVEGVDSCRRRNTSGDGLPADRSGCSTCQAYRLALIS